MPIYEFSCSDCNSVFEILILPKDEEPEKCEKCGSEIKRLISTSSFHLKGSGWYATDYKDGNDSSSNPKGITTKSPIIKDRNTGKTLQGPDIPD